ncbi:MAG: hypothetical protein ABI419_09550 [Ginsengibacter sp.]
MMVRISPAVIGSYTCPHFGGNLLYKLRLVREDKNMAGDIDDFRFS